MGCNCGKKIEMINKKFGDGVQEKEKTNPFMKILEFIMQCLFGILCGVIIIVMIIPMLIYLIICLMFGKQVNFRIKDYSKFFNKEQTEKN